MGHVAPHRWADLAAGKVSEAERDRLESHAADCLRCATARARVTAARAACAAIAATDAPPLRWDHIGARIYWVTSSEKRAVNRPRARRRPLLAVAAFGTVAVVGLLAVLILSRLGGETEPAQVVAPSAPEKAPTVVVAPGLEAAPLYGIVVFAQGEVERDSGPLEVDAVLGAGTRLVTGDGSVAVQFGAGSGLRLGPDSALDLRSFDQGRVELALEGQVAVDLAPQPAGRSFSVVAGDRAVVVRGTAFQVEYRDGGLEVACLRGKVMVTDGVAEVDVAAGHHVHLEAGGLAAAAQVERVGAPDVVGLERATTLPLLPAWPEAEALFATSAVLDLAAAPNHAVEVDGVERGSGPFLLRVMSGRHHVDSEDHSGWVDAAPGSRVAVASVPAPPLPEPSRGTTVRRRQIDSALDHHRARQCLRPLEKQGLVAGSYIVLDIGVTANGSISHLNIVKSNLPADAARCLRDRVDAVTLPAGPAATVRYRIGF